MLARTALFLFLFLTPSLQGQSQRVTEYSGEETVTVADVVGSVQVRYMSLGPGACAVESWTTGGGAQGRLGVLALPGAWTDWTPIVQHTTSLTLTIHNNVKCDTDVRSQVRYFGIDPSPPGWLRRRSSGTPSGSGETVAAGERAVMIVLDSSGSMTGDNLTEAKQGAIEGIRSGMSEGMWVKLVTFGGECDSGVRALTPWTKDENLAIAAVESVVAAGGTPLAPALKESIVDLEQFVRPGAGGVILLSDGQNTCGEMEPALAELRQRGVRFHYETIGVGISGQAQRDMKAIAETTGGTYTDAADASQVRRAFRTSFANLRRFIIEWRPR